MADFYQTINSLNQLLSERQPKTFSSSWILKNSPVSYRFIFKNIRSDVDGIDWDRVVSGISREFQSRWYPRKSNPKKVKFYRNKKEMDLVLKRYRHKLYVFISALDDGDKQLRNDISIVLVRIAQKGNLNAQMMLVKFLKYVVDQGFIEFRDLLNP